ncbi:MAG TPA: amidohydrolase family protein [Terriglobia bacterium]|nr:amidohydrolase family protein [Terriglobia bacterium]
MNRRTFLGVAALLAALDIDMKAQSTPIPIIDTHIHLFDPRRPQGIPWPTKDDARLYKPALPDRYLKVTKGQGVVGAIEVEASPWLEDNQWVLDIAAKAPVIVGTVGDLEPEKPDFPKQLERFHRNPLFRGIRCGNLWGRDITVQLGNPDFVHGLKELADAGLEMDTANPSPELIAAAVRLTDLVPSLRVVIDHLPQMEEPTDPKVKKEVEANLQELGKRPQVYMKMSEVLRRIDGRLRLDLDFYKPSLDRLWDIFGEDRLVYGSDWPNSDHIETYPQELTLVREYVLGKGRAAAEKVFWKNSVAAYRWIKRDPQQPDPATA